MKLAFFPNIFDLEKKISNLKIPVKVRLLIECAHIIVLIIDTKRNILNFILNLNLTSEGSDKKIIYAPNKMYVP